MTQDVLSGAGRTSEQSQGKRVMAMRRLGVGFISLLAACSAVQRVEPAQFIPQHKPSVVSVWIAPDSLTLLSDPSVDGDTLRGLVFNAPWAVPLKEIVRVEAVAPSPARTGLLVAATVSGAAVVYLLASGRGTAQAPCNPQIGCNSVNTSP
jgi:hypothetical protein